MAEKIRINISTLSTDLAEMTRIAKQAKSNLDNLKTNIQALNSTWDGPSHNALAVQFDNDASTMEESLEALNKFLDLVRYARDEYTGCENSVSEKIDAVQV